MEEKNSILIVDDDESTCRSLSLIFRKEGYEIEIARSGQEAIEKVQERFFNVAFLDIKLPDMEGIELIEPLGKICPDMVEIMLTAYASEETAIQAMHNGASDYIIKPINIDEVLLMLRNVLEKQRLVMENRKLLESLQKELIERKRTEEAMKRSEARYQNLIEFAEAGIVVSENNKIIHINKKAEEIYGYSREELIDQFPSILTPWKYRKEHRKILNNIIKSEKPFKTILEEEGLRKDGSLFPIEISYGLTQGEERMIIAVVRDITERKSMEDKLCQAEKLKSLGEMASGVAHDFNNVLAAILGRSQLLHKIVNSFPVEQERRKSIMELLIPTIN